MMHDSFYESCFFVVYQIFAKLSRECYKFLEGRKRQFIRVVSLDSVSIPMDNLYQNLQYSSGKRTKKLFIPNIGVSLTCQKHSESNRVNVIFGGHHSQVRRMYALCEVMRSYSEWKYYTPEAIFLAKRCEIPRSNLTKYLSDFYIFIYLFNKVI